MFKTLIFDLDGTLADTRRDLAEAVNHMRGAFALPPLDLAEVTSYIGDGIGKLIARSLNEPQARDIDPALARKVMGEYYREHIADYSTLYPGVAEGIRRLYELKFFLAVVSNKDTDASNSLLEQLAIGKYFSAVIGGDGGYPLKPSPEALEAVMRLSGCAPGECLMLGDNYTDLAAARNAGAKSALATYGFGNPRGERADIEADDFTEFVFAASRA